MHSVYILENVPVHEILSQCFGRNLYQRSNSQLSEQSAAGAQETAASVEEQTASMQELAKSAQDFSNVAADMQQVVAKFKLDTGNSVHCEEEEEGPETEKKLSDIPKDFLI